MKLEFALPLMLAALPLPLLVAWLLPRAPESTGGALRLPYYEALHASMGEGQDTHSRLRLLLATIAWVLLAIAAARPQIPGEPVQLPVLGAYQIGEVQARSWIVAGIEPSSQAAGRASGSNSRQWRVDQRQLGFSTTRR